MLGRRVRSWSLALAAAALVTAAPASAALRFGLGADYWIYQGGEFNLTFAIDARLAEHFSVGGRFGAMVTTYPYTFGVPIDLDMRVHLGRLYLEGLVGPWILFSEPIFRAHAAFGFGLQSGAVSFGLEVGYLHPSPMAGLRLAFRI